MHSQTALHCSKADRSASNPQHQQHRLLAHAHGLHCIPRLRPDECSYCSRLQDKMGQRQSVYRRCRRWLCMRLDQALVLGDHLHNLQSSLRAWGAPRLNDLGSKLLLLLRNRPVQRNPGSGSAHSQSQTRSQGGRGDSRRKAPVSQWEAQN